MQFPRENIGILPHTNISKNTEIFLNVFMKYFTDKNRNFYNTSFVVFLTINACITITIIGTY